MSDPTKTEADAEPTTNDEALDEKDLEGVAGGTGIHLRKGVAQNLQHVKIDMDACLIPHDPNKQY